MISHQVPAIVVGNAMSRSHIDVESLRQYGIVIGCNAEGLHSEMDYCVAIEQFMIDKLKQDGKCPVLYPAWWNENKDNPGVYMDDWGVITRCPRTDGMDSGRLAVSFAYGKGFDTIYMLGVDFRTPYGTANHIYNKDRMQTRSDTFRDQWNELFAAVKPARVARVGNIPDEDREFFSGLKCELISYEQFWKEVDGQN